MDEGKSVFGAIYARTSPGNRSNYSIDEQVNQCWEYCKKRGWSVRYVFIDQDESGGTVERARFQHMLDKAKAEEFEVIVFWKLDRFCRSLVDLVNIERTLRLRGVQLCSVTEFIDTTTSVGRFNYRNLASVAELERELIGERAKLGLYALAREGRWPNPHPPFGYSKDQEGRLAIIEDEAKIVRRIFRSYVAEKSMPQVPFELNKDRIPARKGSLWDAQAVREVLTNPIYVGRYKVAGVQNEIEGCRIVTEQLLVKANETMLRYRTGKAERPPMPQERRIRKIETLHRQYQEFLRKLELPAHT